MGLAVLIELKFIAAKKNYARVGHVALHLEILAALVAKGGHQTIATGQAIIYLRMLLSRKKSRIGYI
jgi:hypothetical protein